MATVFLRAAPFLADDDAFMKAHIAFEKDPSMAFRMSKEDRERLRKDLGSRMGAFEMDPDPTWRFVPQPLDQLRHLGGLMGFSACGAGFAN
jgi:hypothetical protein